MESAEWNEDARTLTLFDSDELRRRQTVTSRDELVSYLEGLAREVFYANCSRDDGEFLFECDEEGVGEGVQADYEGRLAKFFGEECDEDGEGDGADGQ